MIDSHCHLDHEPLFHDIHNILERSKNAGIKKLLTISTEVTIRSKLRNLTNFIHLLESNQKFMVIEKILLQRINKTDLEELQAQLTVSGFIKKIEEETHKTT